MGMECYGVSLHSAEPPADVIAQAIAQLPHVQFRGEHALFGGWRFVHDDDRHLIELLLTERDGGNCLDIRFALSNHSSIDDSFIEITQWAVDLMFPAIWPMNGTNAVRDSIPFPPDGDFFAVVGTEIEAIRSTWLQMFDPPRGPVEVDQAWDGLLPQEQSRG